MSSAGKKSRAGDIFIGLLIVGFIAAGLGALNSYLQERRETSAIAEDGVETDGTVIVVSQSARFRGGGGGVTLTVSYSPEGAAAVEIADVTVCSEADYDEGTDTVRVVYVPDDPQAVRLAECAGTIDSSLGLIFGIIFLALGLFFLQAFVRSLLRSRSLQTSGR
jgi:hypothetical protein